MGPGPVVRTFVAVVALLLAPVVAMAAIAAPPAHDTADAGAIDLVFDTSEADAVLAILDVRAAGREVPADAWERLFASEPYVRLERREASMHRDFNDDDFRRFVLDPALAARADSLRRTLDAWRHTDLVASARRVRAYLPDSARIRAHVYPVIKPRTNSFVFEASTDPAIFLYLDPLESAAKFENTVAHELHHIGFSSVSRDDSTRYAGLPPATRTALQWLSAFGEGFAMLAAAGGPDVHPHATSPPADRARWDRDLRHFAPDLQALDRFFLDVIDGRLAGDAATERAMTFFGVQGPWYTVGWRMAVVVERHDGRAALIRCMLDPRELLERYDAAARDARGHGGPALPLWSPRLIAALRGRAR